EVDRTSPARGKLAADLKFGKDAELRGVLRNAVLRAPADASTVELGDQLLVVGTATAVTHALSKVRGKREQRRVVIVGGGRVGIQVAASLIAQGRRVQVIEENLSRCELLAAPILAAN